MRWAGVTVSKVTWALGRVSVRCSLATRLVVQKRGGLAIKIGPPRVPGLPPA